MYQSICNFLLKVQLSIEEYKYSFNDILYY
nr:MAG TPA: hypothetical protein [Caudoviricetes sp.]